MKSLGIFLFSTLLTYSSLAQQPAYSTGSAQPAAQKSISNRLGLHSFPAKGQGLEQQQTDELSCYRWAKQDTGFDPVDALTAAQSAKPNSSVSTASSVSAQPGAGARGAARGAAAGAAIGAAAGDAGQGAAIGAASGGIRARMAQRRAYAEAQKQSQMQAQQQAQQQTQAKARTQASMDDFKKAYSACMEAKDYSVK